MASRNYREGKTRLLMLELQNIPYPNRSLEAERFRSGHAKPIFELPCVNAIVAADVSFGKVFQPRPDYCLLSIHLEYLEGPIAF